jgi:undecaprenyl diphosphate synthase
MSATSSLSAASRSAADASDLHVAIIMDGNGRWAKARGIPRALGHRAGVAALKRTVEAAQHLGVRSLTVFGFSTENWSRPAQEVSDLMSLPKIYFESDLARLRREGVRVRVIGRRAGLSNDLLAMIDEAETTTAGNNRFFLQVAFNYGGRADIADAARRLAEAAREGRLDPASIDEAAFEAQLSTAEIAPPDLIIRTSGERRLSNFLLWETAYAELVFQDVLWPDYGSAHLVAALEEFRRRERRYGGADVDDVRATG